MVMLPFCEFRVAANDDTFPSVAVNVLRSGFVRRSELRNCDCAVVKAAKAEDVKIESRMLVPRTMLISKCMVFVYSPVGRCIVPKALIQTGVSLEPVPSCLDEGGLALKCWARPH
jgi:hypothetical protein